MSEEWPGNTGTPTDYLLAMIGQPGTISLGSGVWAREFINGGDGSATTGFTFLHPSAGQADIPKGDPCCGACGYDVPENTAVEGARWQLISRDPLHVEPSLKCICGFHGYVRNGAWEAAE